MAAMLLALLIQAGTGLFANDDIATEGPLYKWVSKAASDRLTSIHHLNHDVIIILVVVHVAAVLFHLVYKKENLITPMITGVKQWPGHFTGDDSQQPFGGRPWWQLLRRARFICWCDKKAGQSPAFFILVFWQRLSAVIIAGGYRSRDKAAEFFAGLLVSIRVVAGFAAGPAVPNWGLIAFKSPPFAAVTSLASSLSVLCI